MYEPTNYESEKKWVRALAQGCRQAYRHLFDVYHKKVYHASRKMGLSHEDAEGVVQDVFLALWEQHKQLDPSLSVNALLITIAKRNIIKKIRKAALNIQYYEWVVHRNEAQVNTTEDEVIFTDLEAYVQQGIDQMPSARKEIFLLNKKQGMTSEEIALRLNLSKRTVENQLYRASKFLKDHLAKESYLQKICTLVLVMFLA
ncbi:RNA polymerase sigma-70 factor [Rapidithrix thailandica]|uniref:RNA polymerase sigma-70 factor n=1 Tax=Rapidithrix thailandica TaxID=413964 RepID=A0AAW9S8S1_9BACT